MKDRGTKDAFPAGLVSTLIREMQTVVLSAQRGTMVWRPALSVKRAYVDTLEILLGWRTVPIVKHALLVNT